MLYQKLVFLNGPFFVCYHYLQNDDFGVVVMFGSWDLCDEIMSHIDDTLPLFHVIFNLLYYDSFCLSSIEIRIGLFYQTINYIWFQLPTPKLGNTCASFL